MWYVLHPRCASSLCHRLNIAVLLSQRPHNSPDNARAHSAIPLLQNTYSLRQCTSLTLHAVTSIDPLPPTKCCVTRRSTEPRATEYQYCAFATSNPPRFRYLPRSWCSFISFIIPLMAIPSPQTQPTACTDPCCGAPVPLSERTPCHFPDHYWNFPRSYNNAELPLVHPPIPQGQYRRKAVHASKTASIKWKNALATGSIGNLDDVDFALAVFDMAEQLWVYCRRAATSS